MHCLTFEYPLTSKGIKETMEELLSTVPFVMCCSMNMYRVHFNFIVICMLIYECTMHAFINWMDFITYLNFLGHHFTELTEKGFIHNLRSMINGQFRHALDQFGWTFFKAVEVEGRGFISVAEYRNLQEAWHVGRAEAEGMFKVDDFLNCKYLILTHTCIRNWPGVQVALTSSQKHGINKLWSRILMLVLNEIFRFNCRCNSYYGFPYISIHYIIDLSFYCIFFQSAHKSVQVFQEL